MKEHMKTLEIVNRGVNLIVDDTAEIPITVGPQIQNSSECSKRNKEIASLFTSE